LLGDGDALDGEEFLGVDGAVDGNGVIAELLNLVEVFEADNAEGGAGETVFAGVLGRAGFAFGGARAGRASGVGAVGCDLCVGSGFA
jgi:hypothetical protein